MLINGRFTLKLQSWITFSQLRGNQSQPNPPPHHLALHFHTLLPPTQKDKMTTVLRPLATDEYS